MPLGECNQGNIQVASSATLFSDNPFSGTQRIQKKVRRSTLPVFFLLLPNVLQRRPSIIDLGIQIRPCYFFRSALHEWAKWCGGGLDPASAGRGIWREMQLEYVKRTDLGRALSEGFSGLSWPLFEFDSLSLWYGCSCDGDGGRKIPSVHVRFLGQPLQCSTCMRPSMCLHLAGYFTLLSRAVFSMTA